MRTVKPIEINVKTVFAGKRTEKQAFIELILYKIRAGGYKQALESSPATSYNGTVVFPSAVSLRETGAEIVHRTAAQFQNAPPDIFPVLDVHAR